MVVFDVVAEKNYDVVVIGGGITGCCAAIAAARQGVKTALVEQNGFLGGVGAYTARFPWNAFINYQENKFVVRGIPLEIADRANGGAARHHLDPVMESLTDVEGPMLRITLAEMVDEAGIDVYFHALAAKPFMEEATVKGVYIQTKQGCILLRSSVLIDAEEFASIAVSAGVDFVRGQENTEKTQIASAMLTLGNVDLDQLISEIEKDPKHVRPREFSPSELDYVIRSLRESPLSCIGSFRAQIEQAKKDGLPMPERDIISGTIYPEVGKLMSVASKVIDVDPADECSISRAELDAYAQVKTLYRFFREYVPGCEKAILESISTQIGIRETIHVRGEYWLDGQDLMDGIIFDDTVATGSYIMDVHSPAHGSVDPCVDLPTYAIPYRSLVPKKIDGLLLAGRCISASHEAMSAFRIIPTMGAIGEGAGMGAALCCLRGCTPREMDGKLVRKCLSESNCEVGLS